MTTHNLHCRSLLFLYVAAQKQDRVSQLQDRKSIHPSATSHLNNANQNLFLVRHTKLWFRFRKNKELGLAEASRGSLALAEGSRGYLMNMYIMLVIVVLEETKTTLKDRQTGVLPCLLYC